MADKTGIEWTDATWNPIRGCSRVSEGCRNCYAESVAYRFSGERMDGKPAPYKGLVQRAPNGMRLPLWNGQIRFVEEHLLDPLRWKKPRRIFVNSMSDLFHENVTDEMLDRIFAVMALCPQHTFQVLTKRPERMLAYLGDAVLAGRLAAVVAHMGHGHKGPAKQMAALKNRERRDLMPLLNVHLGVSVENQKAADERIPLLLQTPAAKRFISAEPLLGSVDLRKLHLPGPNVYANHSLDLDGLSVRIDGSAALNWVIVGGESGAGARPMHPDWARSLRDQCRSAGVPFFFKQWGEWADHGRDITSHDARIDSDGRDVTELPGLWDATDRQMWRVGKKAAGALLDGVEYREMPG